MTILKHGLVLTGMAVAIRRTEMSHAAMRSQAIMKLSQAVLALCLLSTVLVTASAASDGKRSAERLQTATSDQAQVSSYGHADVKRMCLKESKQYNCRSVGCPNILGCVNSTTQDCVNCVTHAIGQ